MNILMRDDCNRTAGSTGLFVIAAWAGANPYGVGAVVRPTTANGLMYESTAAVGAGTSDVVEPVWPVQVGQSIDEVTNPGVDELTWTCKGRDPQWTTEVSPTVWPITNGNAPYNGGKATAIDIVGLSSGRNEFDFAGVTELWAAGWFRIREIVRAAGTVNYTMLRATNAGGDNLLTLAVINAGAGDLYRFVYWNGASVTDDTVAFDRTGIWDFYEIHISGLNSASGMCRTYRNGALLHEHAGDMTGKTCTRFFMSINTGNAGNTFRGDWWNACCGAGRVYRPAISMIL